MPLRRKSPRKSSSTRLDYYRTDGDQDRPNITSRKAAKPPSKNRHTIGYKEAYKKSPPARKKPTKSSSESLYEEESESEGEEKGLVIDRSKKKPTKMVATRSDWGRREGRTNDDEDVDDVENKTSSPELEVSKVSERGRREERTNDDEDVDDVENKTSSPELEVSKV
jgi:hypothetical protein